MSAADQEEVSFPRIKIRITREGWIYLVILLFVSAGALLRNINLLMLMTGIMIAPMFLSWRACRLMLIKLRARRSLPGQFFAEQDARIAWRATNERTVLPTWQLVIQDQMAALHSPAKSLTSVRISIPRIKARESEYATYQVRFPNRGAYLVGPAKISTRFPCGLISAEITIREQSTIVVAPAIGSLNASWDRRLVSHVSGSQAIKRQRGTQDEEFFSLRHWRSGDSRRHIHWRVTAKYNHPVVKQFDSRSDRDFVLLLDLWTPAIADLATGQAIERALSFTSTVFTGLPNAVRGKIATAICGRETVILCDHSGPKLCSQVWKELAGAEPSTSPEIVGGLIKVAEQIPGGTPFYVLSTRPKPGSWGELSTPHDQTSSLSVIEPWIRWLQVDSQEFSELFEPPESLRSTTLRKEEADAVRAASA